MARMHSRKRGKSGSKKPLRKSTPGWLRYSDKEVEMLVIKLAKEEKSTSEIGMILRDTYGIPDVKQLTKKSVSKILKEKDLTPPIPEDLRNIIKKAIQIKKHFDENKKDMTAKRGILLAESKIKRLVKYYKKIGRLPQDWKYDLESVKIYIQ